MRITIKGLTASTITFNTLGIILRGDSARPELYPNSVARHIEIKNDEQMREVISIKNAKMISVEKEDEIVFDPSPVSKPETKNENMTKARIEMEVDAITTKTESPVEIEKEVVEDGPSKKFSGRPKGSKNADPSKIPTAKAAASSLSKIKKVQASKTVVKTNESTEDDTESRITVMTPSGAVNAKAKRSMAPEIQDGERTRASIEAMQKMEEEEKEADFTPVYNEENLPEQDRMGGNAVFATGENGFKKAPMKNSVLPEAESIKKSVKFVDEQDDEISQKEEERAKNAFVDEADESDTEEDDNLIES